MHCCPDRPRIELTAFWAAWSRLASSKMTRADFPPSSKPVGVRLGAVAEMILDAVAPLPVKKILFTSGWLVNAVPATGPPGMTLMTPGGKPTSWAISARRRQV